MLKTLWEYIVRIFGITNTNTTREQWSENMGFAEKYEETEGINFAAIFAGKLATLAVIESSADIVGDNKRVAWLEECLIAIWRRMKRITARMLGTGGCILAPYVKDGELQFDILSQERMMIHEKQGERITEATILADSIQQEERQYFRWVHYYVAENTLYITNRVTDESGNPAEVAEWSGMEDRAISGVDRVLFAYLKCPVDNRSFHDDYGVPITYGCESIIEEINECFAQIRDEFKLKEVKIFADERMFQKDAKTGKYRMPSKVFFAAHGRDNGDMVEIFSPEIRHSSYYNRLQQLFELLERSVGTSRGILTAPQTHASTATEIKAGMYDTYALVCDIRNVLENGIRDYVALCNVLANYYELTPMGEYSVGFDWSYGMLESSTETWEQMKDGLALGLKSKAELRQWLNPNETADEAAAAVKEMEKYLPADESVYSGQ